MSEMDPRTPTEHHNPQPPDPQTTRSETQTPNPIRGSGGLVESWVTAEGEVQRTPGGHWMIPGLGDGAVRAFRPGEPWAELLEAWHRVRGQDGSLHQLTRLVRAGRSFQDPEAVSAMTAPEIQAQPEPRTWVTRLGNVTRHKDGSWEVPSMPRLPAEDRRAQILAEWAVDVYQDPAAYRPDQLADLIETQVYWVGPGAAVPELEPEEEPQVVPVQSMVRDPSGRLVLSGEVQHDPVRAATPAEEADMARARGLIAVADGAAEAREKGLAGMFQESRDVFKAATGPMPMPDSMAEQLDPTATGPQEVFVGSLGGSSEPEPETRTHQVTWAPRAVERADQDLQDLQGWLDAYDKVVDALENGPNPAAYQLPTPHLQTVEVAIDALRQASGEDEPSAVLGVASQPPEHERGEPGLNSLAGLPLGAGRPMAQQLLALEARDYRGPIAPLPRHHRVTDEERQTWLTFGTIDERRAAWERYGAGYRNADNDATMLGFLMAELEHQREWRYEAVADLGSAHDEIARLRAESAEGLGSQRPRDPERIGSDHGARESPRAEVTVASPGTLSDWERGERLIREAAGMLNTVVDESQRPQRTKTAACLATIGRALQAMAEARRSEPSGLGLNEHDVSAIEYAVAHGWKP